MLPTKGFEIRDFLVADVMFLSQLEKLLENGGRRGWPEADLREHHQRRPVCLIFMHSLTLAPNYLWVCDIKESHNNTPISPHDTMMVHILYYLHIFFLKYSFRQIEFSNLGVKILWKGADTILNPPIMITPNKMIYTTRFMINITEVLQTSRRPNRIIESSVIWFGWVFFEIPNWT